MRPYMRRAVLFKITDTDESGRGVLLSKFRVDVSCTERSASQNKLVSEWDPPRHSAIQLKIPGG